ncbi:MAG: hypothetical protein JXA73_22270, partial [Acidobacteria bacterium]|nr:hypothetical protein [Acidobacteriota bacterium]
PHCLRRGALHLPARRSRQNVNLLLRGPLARNSNAKSRLGYCDHLECSHDGFSPLLMAIQVSALPKYGTC